MIDEISMCCKALGDPVRLRIFAYLSSCCSPVTLDDEGNIRKMDGPTVGEICCHITGVHRVTSTISFHLKELRRSGLIRTARRGKYIVCSIDRSTVRRLRRYFEMAEAGELPLDTPTETTGL